MTAAQLMAAAFEQNRAAQDIDFTNLIAEAFANHMPANVSVGGGAPSLKAADIGYFDPSLKDPSGAGVITDGRDTKYCDVFPFCDRLLDLAKTSGEECVRKVWSQCLRGPALVWFSHILTDNDRDLLRTGSVDAICGKLKARFKTDYSTAMGVLKGPKFTLYDILMGRDIMAHVRTMMRNAKACEMGTRAQMIAAFESLDSDIQSDLAKPDGAATVDEFFKDIQEMESVLRQRADKLRRPPQSYPGRQPYHPYGN